MSDPGGRAPRPAIDIDGADRRATVAGSALVALAVLIGGVLLVKGFSNDGGLVATAKSGTSTTTVKPGGDVPATSTTQTTVAVDPATVKVFSANGSGTQSGARRVAGVLEARGFKAVQVSDAPTTIVSVVYFTPGSSAGAALAASTVGLDPTAVQPMPYPAPVDLKGATVLVLIGTDGRLANPGTTTTVKPATSTP